MITLLEIEIPDAAGDMHEYRIPHMPGTKGLALWGQIGGMLSGSMGMLFQDAQGQNPGAVAGSAVRVISTAVKREGGLKFWLQFLDGVIRDGDKMYYGGNGKQSARERHFDAAYAGNLGEFFRLVYHVINHNFGPDVEALIDKAIETKERADEGNLPGALGRLMATLTGSSSEMEEETEA